MLYEGTFGLLFQHAQSLPRLLYGESGLHSFRQLLGIGTVLGICMGSSATCQRILLRYNESADDIELSLPQW